MPLWLIIMIAGATGCGFLFLKAREMEGKQKLKKVKQGHKEVKKAAKHLASIPSGVAEQAPITSEEEVYMSKDVSTRVVEDIEEILRRDGS